MSGQAMSKCQARLAAAPPPEPDVLLSAAQAYLRATNAVIQHAISLSRGEINPPQLFDPARLVPPLQLPAVALRRKIGGVERSFADWYARRDEPGMLSDDRKLVNHIGESARQGIHEGLVLGHRLLAEPSLVDEAVEMQVTVGSIERPGDHLVTGDGEDEVVKPRIVLDEDPVRLVLVVAGGF